MTSQDHIEAVALDLLNTDLVTRDEAEQLATAAISALEKLGAYVPEGWVAVPSEPTDAMFDAACAAWINSYPPYDEWEKPTAGKVVQAIYRAMLDAKPKPQGKE